MKDAINLYVPFVIFNSYSPTTFAAEPKFEFKTLMLAKLSGRFVLRSVTIPLTVSCWAFTVIKRTTTQEYKRGLHSNPNKLLLMITIILIKHFS